MPIGNAVCDEESIEIEIILSYILVCNLNNQRNDDVETQLSGNASDLLIEHTCSRTPPERLIKYNTGKTCKFSTWC